MRRVPTEESEEEGTYTCDMGLRRIGKKKKPRGEEERSGLEETNR